MTKKKEDKVPNAGRPTKYKKEYNDMVVKLCLMGATDKKIADFFNVAESTINLWKLKEPEFSESIKKGKIVADANVAASLYKRATGYEVTTQKAIKVRTHKNGEGSHEDVKVVTVKESFPPDTTAIIFWLKNRVSDVYNDKHQIELPTSTILNLGSGQRPPDEATD